MTSALEELSTELLDMITALLELDDLRSLRLTSRLLEQRISHRALIGFFTHKNIVLTTARLKNMVLVTKKGRPGNNLRCCTITNTIRKKLDPAVEKEHTSLLTEAFSNLKKYSSQSGIISLSLRISTAKSHMPRQYDFNNPDHFHAQRPVWKAAESAFKMVMSALNDSQLSVKEDFNIFSTVKGCSLSCDVFQDSVLSLDPSYGIFRSLKKLTLSLSAPHQTAKGRHGNRDADREHENRGSYSRALFQHIPWLMRNMPALECLNLHWYDIDPTVPAPEVPAALLSSKGNPGNILANQPIPKLALSGIWACESDLLSILDIVRPSLLKLDYVHLVPDGSWDGIFQYLSDPRSSITEYYLDDLCKVLRLLYYDGEPGLPKFRILGGAHLGPTTLARTSDQAKRPIRYRYADSRPLGSPEVRRWMRNKGDEFGTYRQHKYDFIALNMTPVYDPDDDSDL